MADPLRHRQTKGAATDMVDLTPPRHIPTLPSRAVIRGAFRFQRKPYAVQAKHARRRRRTTTRAPDPPAPARPNGSANMAWRPRFQQNTLHPLLGLSQEWAYDICSLFGSQCKNHRAETATFGSADVQVVASIAPASRPRRAGSRPGPLPPSPHRLEPLDCRLGRRHAGNSEWGGRKQGPHLIGDSAIAKTAGMGEATGKAVKGDPLSAAFVMGKICLAGLWQSMRGATRARGTGRS